ncbi:MAG: aminoglycoside phosphotransferase family protein [Anaerolineae bacterium]|nr:aminoglycoside phosphotransferase family protein [Anaerolineae bacterium]
MDDVVDIAQRFVTSPTDTTGTGSGIAVTPYGGGNINDTYLVELAAGPLFILQRINQHVFPKPQLIMINLRTVMEHIGRLPDHAQEERRWELPDIVPARDGQDFVFDANGDFWRAISFIEGARTWPEIKDTQHAREAGYALGRFQRLISDLDVSLLHDTLPGFHIMPRYLQYYDEVLEHHGIDLSKPELRYAADFVADRRAWAPVLQMACAAGKLRERPMHGDPKIDNIMIDNETGLAVGVIDLDTVKPGLVQYDIGDCLRSSCNPLGEETKHVDRVTFELDLCEMILKGYLPEARPFYTTADYDYLFDSLRVLAFEQGLRFFTDYLAHNVYYKVKYPENNLHRTLTQFRLVEHIEAQETQIRQMVRSLAGA